MQDERRSVKALERAHFFVPIGAAVASIIAAALGTLSLFTSLSFKTLTPTWYAIVGGAIAFVVTFTFAAIR
ncbi:MAG TPA: hypothetical protein VJ723_09745, partial [Candidatus Angelobacter sp.]|nr:hypothetical protein [Candidatus Angelobacter sp.]